MDTAEKPSSLVTGSATITFIAGLIGLLGSFIPCFGTLALFVSIPAAIFGIITVVIAKVQNAPRTFPVVATTVALLGVAISWTQMKAMQKIGEAALNHMEESSRAMRERNSPTSSAMPLPTAGRNEASPAAIPEPVLTLDYAFSGRRDPFSAPPSFYESSAEQVTIESGHLIERDENSIFALTYSPDGKQIALCKKLDPDRHILVIAEVCSLAILHEFPVAGRLDKIAWAPAQDRLLCVPDPYRGNDRSVGIITIESGEMIKLPSSAVPPSNFGSSSDRLAWHTDGMIYILGGRLDAYSRKFDLETLSFPLVFGEHSQPSRFGGSTSRSETKPSPYEALEAEILEPRSPRPNWNIAQDGMPGGGSPCLLISSADDSFRRPLVRSVFQSQLVVPSPALDTVVVERNEGIFIYYLTLRQTPTLDFKVAILPGDINDRQRQNFDSALKSKATIWGSLFPAQVNPLNGKLIGPDRDHLKGYALLERVVDGGWHFRVSFESGAIRPGDVITDIRSSSGISLKLNGNSIWRQLEPMHLGATEGVEYQTAGSNPTLPNSGSSGTSVFGSELSDGYSATWDSSDRKLRVEMSWLARFGKTVSTVKINALDTAHAILTPKVGGAFAGSVLVRIPVKSRTSASVERWPVSPTGENPNEPGTVTQATEISFHCKSHAAAATAVGNLNKLSIFTSGIHGDTEPILEKPQILYRARLSANDHINSLGKRLETVGQILRQDRANFHKGKGNLEDQADGRYDSYAEREAMEFLHVVPVGLPEAEWREAIIHGDPLVEVGVTSDSLQVRVLNTKEFALTRGTRRGGYSYGEDGTVEFDGIPFVPAVKIFADDNRTANVFEREDGRFAVVRDNDPDGKNVHWVLDLTRHRSYLASVDCRNVSWSPDGRFVVSEGRFEGSWLQRVNLHTGETLKTKVLGDRDTLWFVEGDIRWAADTSEFLLEIAVHGSPYSERNAGSSERIGGFPAKVDAETLTITRL